MLFGTPTRLQEKMAALEEAKSADLSPVARPGRLRRSGSDGRVGATVSDLPEASRRLASSIDDFVMETRVFPEGTKTAEARPEPSDADLQRSSSPWFSS